MRLSGNGLFIIMAPVPLVEPALPQPGRGYPADLNAYLKIGENGRVSLFCSKIEMGQGIITSMAQMLAEELDVAVESIDMVMGDTSLCPWDSGTTGSRSTKYYGPPLRKAGAEARAILLQMASEKLGIPLEDLVVRDGVITGKGNGPEKVTYAELVRGKRIERQISGVEIKKVSDHTVSGKRMMRTDAVQKVKGEAGFTADLTLPGMLHARLLRPPAHGAKLLAVDVSAAEKTEGTVLVHEKDLGAVLHERRAAAESALRLVSAEWDVPEGSVNDRTIFDHLDRSAPEGRTYVEGGSIAEGNAAAQQIITSGFFNHYVAHAPMEPYAVLAHVKGDQATIWASTQSPFRVRETVAETLNITEENVRVITPFVGGGFGGKKSGQQISEAALLSKITGRPVQLAWIREEEFFFDTFRPAAMVRLESGLDPDGRITSWDCELLFTGTRSSEPVYHIPNFRVTSRNNNNSHPFGTGAWRGPGSNTNVFAMESHTDILAAAAGLDPLSFRMKNLTDERMIRVLQAAAERFDHPFEKGPSGNGFGVCCTNYLNTYVATIAQVSVDRSTGAVRVDRVVCAQDMGEIINPRGAELQIGGGITMGLSAALHEEIRFDGGEIRTRNFDAYRITRFSEAPKIEVLLIDNPDLPPQGCGEPAITTVGAVLANAIFDAVGARVFTLPMTPGRILSAMSSSASLLQNR